MQPTTACGSPAAHASACTVTVFPKAGFDATELKTIVLKHLEFDGPLPTAVTIVNQPRCGVLCSFADADRARRAHSIVRQLSSGPHSGAFASQLCIKHDPDTPRSGGGGGCSPDRRPSLALSKIEVVAPQPRNPASGNPSRICYDSPRKADAAAAVAAAAAEPAPPAPAEPAGSSQLARLGCQRAERAPSSTCANRPSNRDHAMACTPLRAANIPSCGHPAPPSWRVPREWLRSKLIELRPHASKCHLPAPRRRDAAPPLSGLDEMYIMQQSGDACCVKQVGMLTFPQLLCDSLAEARILRGVAALLHMEFCKPPKRVMAKRLKQCYQKLIPSNLQHMLVADCRACAGRRHADVDKRGVEAYLYRVVCPMLARR